MRDRDAALAYLRHAAACYGEDFPLAVAPSRGARLETAPAAPEPLAGPPQAEASDDRPAGATPAAGRDVPTATPAPAAAPLTSTESPAAALAALAAEVSPCVQCKLHENRTNLVFGEGSATARVMFVGEAPGQVEDETGRPFVGRSGQLLDKIIENAMGLRRDDVFIANINKCRPPGNRDPEPDEIAACLPWLRAQIRIIRPEVIVTLGRVALWNLLGSREPMSRMRGQELDYEGTPVVPTWHPAYLLRTPSAKRQTWEDIKRVNRILGLPPVPPKS